MSFEEYEKSLDGYIPHYKKAYQDGAQSRQAEIDELKAKKEFRDLSQDLAIKNIKDGYEKQISSLAKTITKFDLEIDELQKRIDEALNKLCQLQYASAERVYHDVSNILKGQNHD